MDLIPTFRKMREETLNMIYRNMSDEHEPSEGDGDTEGSHQLLTKPDPKTKTPNMYKVVMLNDDFTPRDFVIHVLQKFFSKEEQAATQIMLEIHHKGSGVAGVYSFEIAETKAYQCNEFAKQNSFPLKCMVEKA